MCDLCTGEWEGVVAHSRYQAKLDFPVKCGFRQTPLGESMLPEIVKPGNIIETNYGGPTYYRVNKIVSGTEEGFPPCHSLLLSLIRHGKLYHGDFLINELVAVGGRILKLFENNSDEVFILGHYDDQGVLF